MAVGGQERMEPIQTQIFVGNQVGGGKDCAHRSQRRSSPRRMDAAMTKAWDAYIGRIWFISSEDSLSFDFKRSQSQPGCLVPDGQQDEKEKR